MRFSQGTKSYLYFKDFGKLFFIFEKSRLKFLTCGVESQDFPKIRDDFPKFSQVTHSGFKTVGVIGGVLERSFGLG